LETSAATRAFGSDVVAEVLRRLELPYLALNPGASYRGLHDSVVNHLGNERPELLLCLHEEHAVAVAHGYAKVTERPLAVALHANVGLMHATMAIFNAFCDRVPMLVLGATGPLDAAKRRPWIDWIHTAADQGALVRGSVKWDDQPTSAQAAVESVVHAYAMTMTYPPAPVYVCLDAGMQEAELDAPVAIPDVVRHRAPDPPAPSAGDVDRLLRLVDGAQRPLLLVGRGGRSQRAWDARVRVAERVGARVLTDLKVGAAFPSDHPLAGAAPGTFLTAAGRALVRAADVVVALDWVDLGGTLRHAHAGRPAEVTVVSCTLDVDDGFELAPVDVPVAAHPDLLVAALDGRLEGRAARPGWPAPEAADDAGEPQAGGIPVRTLADALARALHGRESCLVRLPLGWDGRDLHVAGPLDYLGQDGGAGLGSGPGMAVGAALALRGSGRLPVAVLGDGDLLMGASALWTAARYRLPLLVVVANNRSFFNDEVHQQRVALARGRPVENRWIGQHIRDPDPDLAGLARALGLEGQGPVEDDAELAAELERAVAAATGGASVLVDVRVGTSGYPGGVTAS